MATIAIIRFAEAPSTEGAEDFAENAVQGMREYLASHTRGTGALAQSLKATVYGKQIVVESDLPYAKSVDQGFRRSKTLWGLITRVIPIKLKSGTTIFRRVTADSLLRGKWTTRPRPGIGFVEKGAELARGRQSLRARLAFSVQTSAI